MQIGIPKEVKNREYRVGGTPITVKALTHDGHTVLVEKNAGARIGYTDADYQAAGAKIVPSAKQVYTADMVIKVKEPQPKEFPLIRKGQILYCYFHLAPDPMQTKALLKAGAICVAYETVTDNRGRLPLLVPMSEIAGRISVQAGAHALHMVNGGRGVLLGGVPGVLPGTVVIIGGGVSGTQAAQMAVGLGADVIILDNNLYRLGQLSELFGSSLKTLASNGPNLEEALKNADLAIGAVLVPGKLAPKLVSKEMVSTMKKGSVIVDIAIDQGGCFETSRPTTHDDPIFIEQGVVHYCVSNMPGACALTATQALTNATLSHALKIANQGITRALLDDPHLTEGLNLYEGIVTNKAVAEDLGYEYHPPTQVLKSVHG